MTGTTGPRTAGCWSVMVACNDPRSGAFAGKADAFDLLTPAGDIAASFTVGAGPPIRFAMTPGRITLGRHHHFPTIAAATWAGNWCWDRFWLDDAAAARLLRLLWARADCDGGWCSLIGRLEAGERPAPGLLKSVLAEPEDT
jgi:hypothetical protein